MLEKQHTKVLNKIYELIQSSGKNACWGLTGSTSFALQGMDVDVHDIDIQTDEATAYLLGELLADYEVEPVRFRGNEKIRSHFGKFLVDGIEVEVMGDIQKKTEGKWEDIIPLNTLLDYVSYGDKSIPVLRLTYESKAYRKLGRIEKAEQIDGFIKNS